MQVSASRSFSKITSELQNRKRYAKLISSRFLPYIPALMGSVFNRSVSYRRVCVNRWYNEILWVLSYLQGKTHFCVWSRAMQWCTMHACMHLCINIWRATRTRKCEAFSSIALAFAVIRTPKTHMVSGVFLLKKSVWFWLVLSQFIGVKSGLNCPYGLKNGLMMNR